MTSLAYRKYALLVQMASILACTAAGSEAAPKATNVTFVAKWGTQGAGPGQLNGPEQIVLDHSDNLYVAENVNSRISVFTSNGDFVRMWGSPGSGDGQFGFGGLIGVAVGPDGSVYTAERTPNCCIQKFTNDGTFIKKWSCHFGSCPGELETTSGIAVDPDGYVYVSDHDGRIQKFDSEGGYLKTWGDIGPDGCTTGDGPSIFGPSFVQWTPNGNLISAEFVHHQVQTYSSDGALLSSFGCCIFGPGGVANDGNGHVLAGDGLHDFVQVYTPQGQFLTQFGTTGDGDGQFHFPTGVAVDTAGFIYVADLSNNRIQKFAFDGATKARPSSWGALKTHYR